MVCYLNLKGGFKSHEEMCLTFIGYYPALNVTRCWSHPFRENLVKVTNITEWNKRYVLITFEEYVFVYNNNIGSETKKSESNYCFTI